jgi:Ser/Thr protein kinase RdoA (MazF antagonist)
MRSPLECVDSTVAPSALLEAVRDAYLIEGSATCELIQRHLDATYLITSEQGRHVVRLYNAHWWSQEEVDAEVAVLRHLRSSEVRVAAPVVRKDGAWVSSVQAAEGERQLLVYEYLEGEGLLPSRDALSLGELVGRMHRALQDFVLPQRRRELTARALTESTFEAIIAQLSEGNEHRPYLEGLRTRVLRRAEEVGLRTFREGLCHGDLNFSNGVRQADGQIGLFDFENCGKGILAYDLAVFRWAQQLLGAPEQAWQDFVEGYRRSNELPGQELAGMGLLVLLRQAYMLAHDARRTRINSLGSRWCRARRTPQMDTLRELDTELFGARATQAW